MISARTSSSVYADTFRRAEASARLAERKRVLAILALPEARSRWQFAVFIATMTDATVDEARHRLRTEGLAVGSRAQPAPSTLVEGMRRRFTAENEAAAPSSPGYGSSAGTPGGLAAAMRARFEKDPTHA